MPLAARDNLDELYQLTRLIEARLVALERERDALKAQGDSQARIYIMDIEIRALSEESTRLAAAISDILERDLQR